MGIFISPQKTVECVVIALFFAFAMLLSSAKLLGILQSCTYSNKKLITWARKKYNLTLGRHLLLALCCALASAVLALAFSFAGEWAAVVSLAAYLIFFILFIFADTRLSLRSPATLTPRFARLMASVWLVNAIIAYVLVTFLNFADYLWGNALFSDLKYVCLAILPLCMLPIVCLANVLIKIYEVPRNAKYIRDARVKLAKVHPVIVGITGSYGKTSTKIILSAMLSSKYKVLATPRSHNTPLGVAKTINEAALENFDVFIAEMGARHVGDIAELCALCPPDYSIITGICPQHLESFGSMENIVKGKGEILENTKNAAVIAADCYDNFLAYPCKKIKCDCVSGVRSDSEGTTFTLNLGANQRVVHTKLLGAHSAQNIGLCARCAYEMDVSFEDICGAIANLDYVEHRLQLIKSNGVNIIDDGYNSNIEGAESGAESLKAFSGRKVVSAAGVAEAGAKKREINMRLGSALAGVADVVILAGENSRYIEKGLKQRGFSGEIIKTRGINQTAKALPHILRPGDVVWFQNDIP